MRTQKQRWTRWLAEYDGPGFYGREDCKRQAGFVYNHVQCAPMLLWLAEAAGVSIGDLVKAHDAVMAAGKREAARCAPAADHPLGHHGSGAIEAKHVGCTSADQPSLAAPERHPGGRRNASSTRDQLRVDSHSCGFPANEWGQMPANQIDQFDSLGVLL